MEMLGYMCKLSKKSGTNWVAYTNLDGYPKKESPEEVYTKRFPLDVSLLRVLRRSSEA
jgi:hypothetical protein